MTGGRVTYSGTVYPWHCDHMGHMNVMWYAGKFDEATWGFFSMIGLTRSKLDDLRRGLAALEQNLSYRRELFPGDTVIIRTRLVEISGKTIRFVHEMTNRESGEVAAACELLAVCLDTRTRKAAILPDGVAALAYEKFYQAGERSSGE